MRVRACICVLVSIIDPFTIDVAGAGRRDPGGSNPQRPLPRSPRSTRRGATQKEERHDAGVWQSVRKKV